MMQAKYNLYVNKTVYKHSHSFWICNYLDHCMRLPNKGLQKLKDIKKLRINKIEDNLFLILDILYFIEKFRK